MPFKGGATDKIGNRYEDYWTIDCIIDILKEKADLIQLEPLGFEGEGVEFFLIRGSKREYHQVKRQHNTGKWTVNSLGSVLENFFKKLKDKDVTCHFISSSSATELEELIYQVNASEFLEFKSRLKGSYIKAWDTITSLDISLSEEEVYCALKRIFIEIRSEKSLKKGILDRLETVVNANPMDTKSWFFEYVFEQVHSKLTMHSIWGDLKKAGFSPTEWYKDHSVIGCVNDINGRYLRRIKDVEFSINPIFRTETKTVIEKIKSKEDIIITGSAGIGKSGIISQILDELEDKTIPFFVLDVENEKLDSSARKLGLNLGLPGSPVNVLENIAQDNECVFIIDQLDSLSIIQGKKLGFLNCIYELIAQAKNYPNINLVLVCRDFDLKNDKRLKNIQKKYEINEISIKPLSIEELKEYIKTELKLDPEEFKKPQLEILSVPLHLKLFSEIIESSGPYLTFNSEIELYNEYWDTKKRYIENKVGRVIKWDFIISVLCGYISKKQNLKAPKFVLDKYSSDAEIMASEGVLISDSDYYGFFHGSFFDYSFARVFVSNNKDLLTFLLSDEQYLFKRSQVRQILSYKRSFKKGLFDEYIEDINTLLNNPNVRFHIKILILELFSKLEDPTEGEWSLIAPLTKDKDNPLSKEAWKTLFNLPWFDLLDSLEVHEDNLNSKDEYLIDKTIQLFFNVRRKTDRIADLIEPYLGKSPRWNEKLIYLVERADLSKEKNFKQFLRLIDEGILEKATRYKRNDYWDDIGYSIDRLAQSHPEKSIEVVSHYLEGKLKLALSNGQKNPFMEDFTNDSNLIQDRSFDDKDFINMAEKSPEEFVNKILPIMLNLMELNSDKKSPKPFKDKIWRFRSYKSIRYRSSEIILYSMEKALRKLASEDMNSFKKWDDILRKSNFETAHYLLIRSYSANGKIYSNKAVDYLVNNSNNLKIGCYNAHFWANRLLIEAISPYCLYSKFKKLEMILLGYFTHQQVFYKWVCTFYPNYCMDFGSYEYYKAKTQLGLLEAIPLHLRSIKVNSRINELSELFDISDEKPTKMEAITVTSPIPEEKARKLSDEEWLDVISEYNKEKEIFEGGPYELSHILENLVKENPNRFAKLVLKFPDNANVNYFNAVLRGISDSKLDFDSVLNVCKRCHALPNKSCGRWITQPIANFTEKKLPDEALEIIKWYILNDPDPEKDEYYDNRIFESGINSVRGIVALSMSKLIFYNKANLNPFYSTLKVIVNDPSISVRSCIAETLIGVLKHEPYLAIDLFKKLCNIDDVLLQTRQIERFLFYNLRNNFENIAEIIYRMIFSDNSAVAIVGSRLISYSILNGKNLLEFDFCLNYSEIHRLGIVQVFSEYLAISPPILIKNVLSRLFNDPSDEVRAEASTCFRKIDDENIVNYTDLIKEFIYSPAFKGNSRSLMYSLQDIEILPDITLEVCNQFFNVEGKDAGDMRTEAYGIAEVVAEIILRIYSKTKNNDIREKSLDLIDKMLICDSEMIDSKLSIFER